MSLSNDCHFFSFSLLKFIFILCAVVFCLHVCLCEGIGSLGTGFRGRCRESNPGPLEKQLVLSAESSFLASRFPLSLLLRTGFTI